MKQLTIKKVLFTALFTFLLMQKSYCQNLYLDPTTTLALGMYSNVMEKKQKETIEQQTKLQQAQAYVATQMAWANDIQNKVYKGLKEVSGTLQNGIQVQKIYQNVNKCISYSSDITDLVAEHPQYAVFGAKTTQLAFERVTEISADITDILTGGEKDLATAGDRYKVLFSLDQKITNLRIILLTIKINIERAIRVGFWKSINPFQGYINTDKDIIENIMQQYKHIF